MALSWAKEHRSEVMFVVGALSWTALICLLGLLHYNQARSDTFAIATAAARYSYEQDILYRQWATLHGGVYVPVTPDNQPNPYLSNIPEQNIVTPSGKMLTLVNPALMTRQVHELATKRGSLYGHITSLHPIRPENAPDPWETKALQAFEAGQTEVVSLEPLQGKLHLRLMRPMRVEEGCLKCHAQYGAQLGDIRGGISVSIPWAPNENALLAQRDTILAGYGGIWLIGLMGLVFAHNQVKKHLVERQRGEKSVTSFNEKLTELHKVTNELSLIEDFDELCRQAVELGRSRLGFSRLSLWFLDKPRQDKESFSTVVRGAFGTSTTGQTLDERHIKHGHDATFEDLLYRGDRLFYEPGPGPLRDGEGNAVGMGARAMAFLWDGAVIIGSMSADDLLAPGSLTKQQAEILVLYAASVGHLCSRKRSELALYESEFKLKQSQQVALVGHYDLDVSSGLWTCSDVLSEIFGFEPGISWSIDDWFNHLHPDDREIMKTHFEQDILGKRAKLDREYRIVRVTDQAVRWVHSIGTLYLGADGEPVKIFGTVQDITQRKQLELTREKLEEQLRQVQKMEAVGQLAGGIAHDFNNLLQVIMGHLELVQVNMEKDSRSHRGLDVINQAAGRAAELTRQLLAFSRRQVIRPINVDPNELIRGVLKMMRRVIGEHIELRFIPGDQLGTIHADPGQMEQVLMNLCVNARDAMPEGGSLTIETENVLLGTDYCRTHSWATQGRFVLLSLSDTGHGMDGETQEQIFEPFFTTKPIGQGTGLGLATVYGIVQQHNGQIRVYSEPGKGTTFKIYLPIVERAAEVIGPKIQPAVTGGTETILVAEDEAMVRELVVRVLREAGYTVLIASDGEEAISIFEKHPETVHLALFDIVMPKLGGREAMERIQSRSPNTHFLFSSGYTENALHTNFVLKDGMRLISKPYRREELLRAVRNALDHT